VFTHASWSERRSDSYERLAFLGDSVLSLSVTAYLYPRFEAERYGAGRLTKIRAQAVSGRACKEVAEELGVPERLLAAAPASAPTALTGTERVLASVLEAVIGACYLAFGFERTAEAVADAFQEQVEEAVEHPEDSKSALQELLARHGDTVDYTVTEEAGPPHDRTFEVAATVNGDVVGRGTGRSKKDAEQAAARAALHELES
jgi:ribonuclease III